MRINHNISALNTYRQLASNTSNTTKSLEKLSSGLRINRAGDDAAGLAISEKMRAQIRGLDQASRNSQDGISLIQTAEGALQETHSILQRMRELATQASNDTNVDVDREEIQREINQLTSEINRISETTQFNKITLLTGELNLQGPMTAQAKGGAVAGNVEILAAATKAIAEGGALASVNISAVGGPTVTGTKAFADPSAADSGPKLERTAATVAGSSLASVTGIIDGYAGPAVTFSKTFTPGGAAGEVTAGDNEIQITLNGESATLVLAAKDYDGDTDNTVEDFINDLNAQIGSSSLTDKAHLSFVLNQENKIELRTDTAADTLAVNGGGLVTSTMLDAPSDTFDTTAKTANNVLTLSVNGNTQSIALDDGIYDFSDSDDQEAFLADINGKLDAAFGAGTVEASFDSGKLTFTNSLTGSGSRIENITGSAADLLGLESVDNAQGTENNELQVSYNGVQKNLNLATVDYSAGGGDGAEDFISDIQEKLDSAFGIGNITVSFDAGNKVVFTAKNVGDTLTIDGGGAAALLKVSSSDAFESGISGAGNNSLTLTVNGTTKSITLSDGTYDFSSQTDRDNFTNDLNSKLNTAFGAGNVRAEFGAGNKLILIDNLEGAGSTLANITGTATSVLGLTAAQYESGRNANNQGTITVDGHAVNISLGAGTYSKASMATELQTQIRNAHASLAGTTVDFVDGSFVITSGAQGSAGSVSVSAGDLTATLKLTADQGGTFTAGSNAVDKGLRLQVGANANQSMAVDISDMRSKALKISSSVSGGTVGSSDLKTAFYVTDPNVTDGTNANVEYALDVSTSDRATVAVSVMDDAIQAVSAERSKLGAFQNRLEHTINNLGTSSENLTAAESRIRDVDMAKEMMEFTKSNILTQAAQAMMAQANQQPQGVLQLLR